jgi:hypothetical protein
MFWHLTDPTGNELISLSSKSTLKVQLLKIWHDDVEDF